MDDEQEERDDLTGAEAEEAEETGMSGEEAHRAGEFEDLRGMLADLLEQVRAMREDMGNWAMTANAAIIDNGAVVVDDNAGADVVIADEPENPFERDYYSDVR